MEIANVRDGAEERQAIAFEWHVASPLCSVTIFLLQKLRSAVKCPFPVALFVAQVWRPSTPSRQACARCGSIYAPHRKQVMQQGTWPICLEVVIAQH